MPDLPLLFPTPRRIAHYPGVYTLPPQALILLDVLHPQEVVFAARYFQKVLPPAVQWELVANATVPREQVALALRLAPTRVPQDQGYELTIVPTGITLYAHDGAGLFYGLLTLMQLVRASDPHAQLPCLQISDWPDFPVRGVMLDVSRGKVPTLETLCALVDVLAHWKINQLQLYTEHTFAYRQHPEVWAEASPLTGQDILILNAYCRERFVELVPNQNLFGHFQRWLKHPRYAPLAEIHGPFKDNEGQVLNGPFSLCPVDPGSLTLVTSLLDELLPHFTSDMVNVGCDETFDLGAGRSRAVCEAQGISQVYLDFLLQIHQAVTARGYQMQFWGDIILRYVELLPLLPKDAQVLVWGYEANHEFDFQSSLLARAGLPFYVCPGTSSWNSLAGRTDNALANLANAAESGLKHGAVGYLITDWGDNGHWQPLLVSYLGFAAGAGYSWAWETNAQADLNAVLNRDVFQGSAHNLGTQSLGAQNLGQVAYALGNVYRAVGLEPKNASAVFHALHDSPEVFRARYGHLPSEAWARAREAVETAAAPLASFIPDNAAMTLYQREFMLAAQLMRHACHRALWINNPSASVGELLQRELRNLLAEFEAVWLARNRPGGLAESLGRFERILGEYQLG